MRQRPGSLSNDGRVPGVRLGFSGVWIGDAPHSQARNAADRDTLGLGDSDQQGADGRGLVHDQQHGALAGINTNEDIDVLMSCGGRQYSQASPQHGRR